VDRREERQVKVGQDVKLKFATEELSQQPGRVRRVYGDGSFQVSFPALRDKNGHRVGQRYTYPASAAPCFQVTA
jgi:hypothetical protein